MLFNTLDFAIFLPVTFAIYWVLKDNLKSQNLIVLVASYVFYGWWDWKFLLLILFSTVVDYMVGLAMSRTSHSGKRKLLLTSSIVVNLGFLGFFKYYNFFLENFVKAFSFLGTDISASSLNIILPVGISFYTFQTLSYSIDVYRKKLEPCQDFISFAAFVSFFPQLVAGPIERATNLLPQFYNKRHFNYTKAVDGLRQILWGGFKKVVIADNCAQFVNQIFGNSAELNGSTLLLGAFFFAFQIYGDFSGYSDIAIGTARLFGFNLMQNFAFPYFSRDIGEFWRRWHISLSTWFRDYIYIPLGGSRRGTPRNIVNVFVIFIVSGFWHGANWTFIVWGLIHALLFIPLLVLGRNRKNLDVIASNSNFPNLKSTISVLITFGLITIAWIFFRADSLSHAINYCSEIFSFSIIEFPVFQGERVAFLYLIFIVFLLIIEWIGRRNQYALERFAFSWPRGLRLSFYSLLAFSILLFIGEKEQFIYFQF